MRRHRFITDLDLSADILTVSNPELINQWHKVLRLKPGEEIILADGGGHEVVAKIVILSDDQAKLEILTREDFSGQLKRQVTLYLAVLKRDNFELAAAKAVECGVSEIVPIITERTIKLGLNRERLEKIIREAAEQSGQVILPTLGESLDLEAALEATSSTAQLFDPSGEKFVSGSVPKAVSIFIGPEGGFTSRELELAQARGAKIVSLGKNILRAETAAMVATYLAANS